MGILGKTQNLFGVILAQSKVEGLGIFLAAMLQAIHAVKSEKQFQKFLQWFESDMISMKALVCYQLFAIANNELGLHFEEESFRFDPNIDLEGIQAVRMMDLLCQKVNLGELDPDSEEYRSLAPIIAMFKEVVILIRSGLYDEAEQTLNYRIMYGNNLYMEILKITIVKASKLGTNLGYATFSKES